MPYDKKTFLQNVAVLTDTREQKNGHVIARLEELGVRHESGKLQIPSSGRSACKCT